MDEIQYWKVKTQPISANSYNEMRNKALFLFSLIEKKTKRKPYIRAKYFRKQKVFLHHFWTHLFEKNPKDRMRRLRYFPCTIELLEHSSLRPEIVKPTKKDALTWYRFFGETGTGDKFIVQVKESRNGQKYLMSMFPVK